MTHRIVLDTNALVQMISRHSPYYEIWQAFQKEKFGLCVSNDIITEYREIIEEQTTSQFVAENVVNLIMHHPLTELFDPRFRFEFIKADPDDNKFVDCAIIANADYIVSDDAHFNELKSLPPSFQITVRKLDEFLESIKQGE